MSNPPPYLSATTACSSSVLARITSAEAALMERRRHTPEELVFDRFNTIITLEVALSRSLLLAEMDGIIRDLAGLRGTYRIVDKTVRAVELLFAHLDELGVKKALFYLVSRYPTPDASERCCWIRQGIMRWRSRRSCTPVRTVCSPAWNGWSQQTQLFWINAEAGPAKRAASAAGSNTPWSGLRWCGTHENAL